MFNVSNNYFSSSSSSPNLIHYHSYDRIPTSYYPTNEYETYSFDDNNPTWDTNDIGIEGSTAAPRVFKRRVTTNKKERRRTQSINTAFSDLRTAIPNVLPDTKLSKIKTLKLATKYIEYLMDILSKDDPNAIPSGFKAEISRTRKDHRFDNSSSSSSTRNRGRTGWPQTVWQSELNRYDSSS